MCLVLWGRKLNEVKLDVSCADLSLCVTHTLRSCPSEFDPVTLDIELRWPFINGHTVFLNDTHKRYFPWKCEECCVWEREPSFDLFLWMSACVCVCSPLLSVFLKAEVALFKSALYNFPNECVQTLSETQPQPQHNSG